MGQYLKLFETHENYADFVNSGEMLRPNVSHCISENHVHYNPFIDYSKLYLTFESLEDDNTIYLKASDDTITKTVSVSTDNGSTWTEYTSSSTNVNGTTLATLNTGDKLLVKGENSTYATFSKHNYFKSTKQFEIKGNIMSLVSGDLFVDTNELTATYTFRLLFWNCTGLISAENLSLPATTLTNSCYSSMFNSCTNLTTIPELPATTLVNHCYDSMFSDCTSLIKEAVVPSSVIPISLSYCYSMYCDCTGITSPNGNYNESAYICRGLS